MAGTPRASKVGPWRALQRAFLTGVGVVLPFAVTLWLLIAFVGFVDQNVLPLLPEPLRTTAAKVPGAGLMFAMVALTLLGALTANLFGRLIVRELEDLVERMPLVRSVYGGSKQVFKQFATPEEQKAFKDPVLIEFPRAGAWTIGFITNGCTDDVASGCVAVYVPQAPIPTSGFLIYARRADLMPLAMSSEEALKRVISLGTVSQDLGVLVQVTHNEA
jgi:uncharacterized membrane protein